ncbi:hypothetical protein DPM19_07210 [Actinomadura craniellae]|uniref:Uncharacterized protein n=1 Tax=Actinomadura craniellae TaxID=2231787 RepID=A0A365H8Z8_9ACTN|nr:hypothetical protein [Actinomadura craniellae]RAY15575.1 hypothetical protein DPM19_07210 [Actinomadura craniellae]
MGDRWGRHLLVLGILWGWMPALGWLLWSLSRWLMPGLKFNQDLASLVQRWFFPHGDLSALTALGWLWVVTGLVISAIYLTAAWDDGDGDGGTLALAALCVLLALAVACFLLPPAFWDNDKDTGRHYGATTVFHLPDLTRVPGSMTDLLQGSRPGDGKNCDRLGAHDVHACVKRDASFSGLRWEARTSSLAAARTAMANAASPVQQVDVLDDSVTYLWGETKDSGRWSGLLDGSGDHRPMYGVAEWDGTTNTARICRFDTSYRINRAFSGTQLNSMRNLLAERYPALHYESTDIWGYCQNDRPVIVIPVQRQIGYESRTVMTAGGVLVIRGSASGRPAIEHRGRVRPGELPGPVYPISLVRAQRDAVQWAAGRGHRDRSGFGFERTDFRTQAENRGEYLLRGADRRLYYVTPMTPRASRSQSLIAYGIAPADQVDDRRLNRYHVHVLADGDPAVASLNTLNAQAVAHISGPSSPHPNFLNSGGSLQEFLPLGGEMWRVYGVQNGQTVFYIDLSATGRTEPRTVRGQAAAPPPAPGAGPAATGCGRPVAELSPKELADCLGRFADELQRRATAPPATPSPRG